MHVLCDGNGAFNKVVGADAGREEEGAADAKALPLPMPELVIALI